MVQQKVIVFVVHNLIVEIYGCSNFVKGKTVYDLLVVFWKFKDHNVTSKRTTIIKLRKELQNVNLFFSMNYI